MGKAKLQTVSDHIFWSYANLAMAHSAVEKGLENYNVPSYMIRAKIFKGLKIGTMSIHSFYDDEKVKMSSGKICSYCGGCENLSLDHVIPRYKEGEDIADNLMVACRSCNSSKGQKDLIEWMNTKGGFLPILVLRRYLKLVYYYCRDHKLLDDSWESALLRDLPFNLSVLPEKFPKPSVLKISYDFRVFTNHKKYPNKIIFCLDTLVRNNHLCNL